MLVREGLMVQGGFVWFRESIKTTLPTFFYSFLYNSYLITIVFLYIIIIKENREGREGREGCFQIGGKKKIYTIYIFLNKWF
jgi:hypothetical protein